MKAYSIHKRPSAGFSLMELLVVVSIIVILAGLTIGAMAYVNQKQARKQAEVQIGLLQMALQEYHADKGEFPMRASSTGKSGTTTITRALFPNAEDEKVYLTELDPDNDSQGWVSGTKIMDPWGSEYFYRTNNPSKPTRSYASNPDFDLWSAGPDGKTKASSNGGYDPKHKDNLDDVRGW